MIEYPETICLFHPNRMWEWDGYGWICAGCVLEPSEYRPDFWVIERWRSLVHLHHWQCEGTETLTGADHMTVDILLWVIAEHERKVR